MSKKIILFSVAVIMTGSLLLCGCYRSETKMKVNKKAKVKTTESIMASSAYYEADSDEEITADDIYKNLKKEIKDSYKKSKKTLKFKKIKKTVNDEKYYGYKVTGIKSSDLKYLKSYKKKGRIYVVLDLKKMGNSSSGSEDAEDVDLKSLVPMLQASGMSEKFKITFPKKPKTTYGKVKGKTVTIDMMKAIAKYNGKKNKKIKMSCKA